MAEINGANASDDFENVRPQTARIGKILTNTGIGVLRYSLVAILLYYGSFKFHPVEAKAIQPLVANSPFMSWMYSVFSLQAVSNIVGAAEIIFAVLIALRFVSSRLSAIGSLGYCHDTDDADFFVHHAGRVVERAGISAAGCHSDRRVFTQGRFSARRGNCNGGRGIRKSSSLETIRCLVTIPI